MNLDFENGYERLYNMTTYLRFREQIFPFTLLYFQYIMYLQVTTFKIVI